MIKLALLTTDSREHYKDYGSPQPAFGTAPEALLEGFRLMPDQIEVHVVSCLQRLPGCSHSQLAENIHYHPLHVPEIGWLKTGYQGCIRAVRGKLRDIRPDIVHGQGTERDCSMSAVFSGYPNVITIHGHMARIAERILAKPLSYYWLAARLERLCLHMTNGVVAISSYTARSVSGLTRRFWIVRNAVHGDFFDVRRTTQTGKKLVCIAHISPWKNQVGLIKALDHLSRRLEFELQFVGSAKQDAYSREFLRMVAARNWCTFSGPLGREQIRSLLSSANAMILPSLEENCPMAILEAAAAGVPVAAAAVGGIPDLLANGKSGLLFDPNDPHAIEEAAAMILVDQTRAGQMALAAKRECLSRNAPPVVARRHLEIYREVVDSFRKSMRSERTIATAP